MNTLNMSMEDYKDHKFHMRDKGKFNLLKS